MAAQIRVETPADGLTVVTVVTPQNIEELNHRWAEGLGFSPTWEDESGRPLLDALRSIAVSEAGAVVIDLTAMKTGSAAVAAAINEAWLDLSEQARGMALVATDDLAFALSIRGLQVRCPVAGSLTDAIPLALTSPAVQPIDQQTTKNLDAIEPRLHSLIRERIGHLYSGGSPPCPPVGRLFKSGVTSGGLAFPYGGLSWRMTGVGADLRLEYDDHARIAPGWGRRYLISANDTSLTQEGLD